jgi:hypothetical protein
MSVHSDSVGEGRDLLSTFPTWVPLMSLNLAGPGTMSWLCYGGFGPDIAEELFFGQLKPIPSFFPVIPFQHPFPLLPLFCPSFHAELVFRNTS